jgi:hypothetical protein
MENGTHLNTSELVQNSFTDSEELETGGKSEEYTAEKTNQRAIYDLLLGILKTFQLSTKEDAKRAMENVAKESAKPSDSKNSVNKTMII